VNVAVCQLKPGSLKNPEEAKITATFSPDFSAESVPAAWFLPWTNTVEPFTWNVTAFPFSTVSYGPVRATFTANELLPTEPSVPAAKWQLQSTWIRFAVRLPFAAASAWTRTRSPAAMLDLPLPYTICVEESIPTFRVSPFSCVSCGPVTRTFTLTEPEPADTTEPAKNSPCGRAAFAGVVVVGVIVDGGSLSASAANGRAAAARSTTAATPNDFVFMRLIVPAAGTALVSRRSNARKAFPRRYGHVVELGIYSFAELDEGQSPGERLRDLLEEIELADEVGLDVFGVGEHHRPDFAVSAPAVVLAAAAVRTRRIRLTSAVSVISSDDPIRVFQQFATVDQLSGGRAEIMAGRGSFIESFPLFGYDLGDYDRLFAEKLDRLLDIRSRPAELGVYPVPAQPMLPVWIAVGGTPESAARAGMLGLPMALAIIGGMPERFVPFAEIHREAAAEAGHDPVPPLSINSHGLVSDTSQEAADLAFPAMKRAMDRIGRERGWPPLERPTFEASRTLRGANFVGSAEEVAEKILYQHELFGHHRFLVQFSVGPLPHEAVMRSIELFGSEVAPVVRKELATAGIP